MRTFCFACKRILLSGGLLLAAATLAGSSCLPPEPEVKPDPVVVSTDVGVFYRKVILVGGSSPAAGFTQPAKFGFGPDGRLYVTTYTGSLFALSLDANHEVTGVEEFKPLGERLLTGFAFDPKAPANAPVMYLAHNSQPLIGAAEGTGAVSRIDGLGTGPAQDVIVGLPRSAENHMTFSLSFGPDDRLYISQGGNTNNGAPAPGLFQNRPETPLSAAILVADVHHPQFAGLSSVEVYAPGLRNPYGMTWHSNGQLYALDQGADLGFGGPPAADGSALPEVPGREDSLLQVLPGKYYGHPNPARGQYAYFASLPDGTPYLPPLKYFTSGAVVTGIAEYTSTANGGKLHKQLLVTGFVDQNLYRVALSPDNSSAADEGILDTGFDNPLDVAVGADGAIYVLEAGGTLAFGGTGPARITVLEPLGPSGSTTGKIDLFATAPVCSQCHTSLTDSGGADVSIDTQWRSTMMANAARDPYFLAKLSSETARTPARRDAIEAKCATCHTPMARTQSLNNDEEVALSAGGFLDAAHPLHALAVDGVSCTLCHQIQNIGLGQVSSFSGGYDIDSFTSPPDRLLFGPFFNPQTDLMRAASNFTPARGAQMTEAGLCGSCHTLYTDTLDAEGNVLGQFPEQTPYLEWRHSEYGKGAGPTCQGCHLPPAEGPVVISVLPETGLTAHAPFGQHHFVGGNQFMVALMSDHAAVLGVEASPAELSATLIRTLDQLQEKAAGLLIASARIEAGNLHADIDVANRAGHKLPTGYPARRAWLHVTVSDANQAIVFESGAVDARGAIAGDNANEDASTFEPHYDVITNPHEVQIYQAVMGDPQGQVTHTLMRAHSYLKDNRLLPSGFDKQTADPDVAVRGLAVADDDFLGGSDRVTYLIPLGAAALPITLKAELLYDSVPPTTIDDLRSTVTPEVTKFLAMFDSADHEPVIMRAAILVVP